MSTYLVTFGNIFESAKFIQNPKQYFTHFTKYELKNYNSKFFQITTPMSDTFLYNLLKRDFPHTKVVLKLQKRRVNYVTL